MRRARRRRGARRADGGGPKRSASKARASSARQTFGGFASVGPFLLRFTGAFVAGLVAYVDEELADQALEHEGALGVGDLLAGLHDLVLGPGCELDVAVS